MAVSGVEAPPVPDPTPLTTEQLLREIANVKEFIDAQFEAVEHLTGEKFRSVDQQLALVERQRVEQKSDTKAAVDAALTAQKEAVKEQTTATATAIAKSETITSEQLKQLGVNFQTAIAGITSNVADIKDRVVAIEAQKRGNTEQKEETRSAGAATMAIIGFVITLIMSGITVLGVLAIK